MGASGTLIPVLGTIEGERIMSLSRTTFHLLAMTLVLLGTQLAEAQRLQPFGDVNFDSDFELFASREFDDYGDPEPPRTGFFATYDRVYMNMSRPENSVQVRAGFPEFSFGDPAPEEIGDLEVGDLTLVATQGGSNDGDFTWGNRFELGYMTEDDHGWLLNVWNIEPNKMIFDREQITRSGTVINDMLDEPVPLENSINQGSFSDVEIMKVFRLRPLHNGAVIEPYLGVRWSKFTDRTFSDDYTGEMRIQDAQDEDDTVTPPIPALPQVDADVYQSLTTAHENNMYGGQLGTRIHTRRGHWILSGEFRTFAMYNRVLFSGATYTQSNIQVDDGGIGTSVDRTPFSEKRDAFVWGGEVRLDATYEVTRAISLRAGVDAMQFGRGIGRGPTFGSDEDLWLIGMTFGVAVNR